MAARAAGALLGLDLGTSTVKAVLLEADGRTHSAAVAHPIRELRPGWAEQDVDGWWQATCRAVQQLREQPEAAAALARLHGIGLSGQMHGTVVLDRALRPLGPAIIWADSRSSAEADSLNAAFERAGLARQAGGRVAPGFMAATLAWLHTNQPATWAAMASCVLPKDALRLRLTGGPPLSDASDASSTGLFDIARRTWSEAAAEQVGIHPGVLPPIREAPEIVGRLTAEAAEVLDLPAGVPVIAGGADQGMALVGAGVVQPGDLLVSVSSGGQLVAPLAQPVVDAELRSHTFCHVLPGRTFAQAATLAAGLSLRWLRQQILGDPSDTAFAELLDAAATLPPGADGLLFLPYLLGERCPHPDPAARGVLAGLSMRHGHAHLLRAVLEGVAFSLCDALDVLIAAGVRPERLIAAGGGMQLPLWRRILADVLGRPLLPLETADQSALGAAILAGISTGVFPDLAGAVHDHVRYGPPVIPNPAAAAQYGRLFPRYRQLYPLSRVGGEG